MELERVSKRCGDIQVIENVALQYLKGRSSDWSERMVWEDNFVKAAGRFSSPG